jgi:hypothetical protein
MPRRRIADKRRSHKEAEEHEDLWTYGIDKTGLLNDYDKAKELWEAVRDEYLGYFPVGTIDPKWGTIEYGPAGWWLFECPGAPFQYEAIEGLGALESHQHQKHLALQKWGIIPPGTPDPQLIARAGEIERFYQTKVSGNLNFLPFPYGTKPEEMEAYFQKVKAERQAWIKLGYLKE